VTDGTNLKTLVLLCPDLETLGQGLDLQELEQWLQETMPPVLVQGVPDLVLRSGELARAVAASGAARLVLGLSCGQYSTAEVQVEARKAGLDPLGLEVINLGAYAALVDPRSLATEKAKILLAAAVARARAYQGSQAQNVKPCLPTRLGRRSLFNLSLLEYRPVPSIRVECCAAAYGCEQCVRVCPRGALGGINSRISLKKSLCESCGLCLTACPQEAVEFPGYAPTQLAAQITTLLDPDVGTLQPRAILFTCRRGARALEGLARRGKIYPVDWLPVQMPCLGMVSPAWILACLSLGARAVGLVSCPGHCPFGQDEIIEGRVTFCRELLRRLDGSYQTVSLLRLADLREPKSIQAQAPSTRTRQHKAFVPRTCSFPSIDPQSAAEVFLHLAQVDGATAEVSLTHPNSPFGVVEVTDGCTACGMCAVACSTGALALEREDGNIALTFDASLCMACAQCLPTCPEASSQVLQLQRITDLQRLSQGRVVLYQDQDRRCDACGAPIASAQMLRRMATLLGDESSIASLITRYCPECRQLFG